MPSGEPLNAVLLDGQSYISQSGNLYCFVRAGDGAVRVICQHAPDAADIAEVEAYIRGRIMG